jgi:hypothetical protein
MHTHKREATYLALMMEATGASETSVYFDKTIRR